MTSTCDHCTNRINHRPQLLYTVCPCCNQLTTIVSQDTEESQSNCRAKDIHVSIQHGKFENISTVQRLLKQHGERLSDLETLTEEFESQLAQIERLIRITLSWQCPDCHGKLVLDESGQMYCPECQTTYPQRLTLKDV